MKLRIENGCFGSIIYVDDKNIEEYSEKEIDAIYNIIVDKLPSIIPKTIIIRELMESFGYTETLEL